MSKFRNVKLRYKIGVGVATAAAVVAGGGIAFAYFTTNGSGSGTGSVGSTSASSSGWAVAVTSSTTAVYPGGTADSMPFTVTNTTPGNEGLSTITVSVATTATGCQAAWYSVTVGGTTTAGTNAGTNPDTFTLSAPDDIAASGTYAGTVTLSLVDANQNQDACEGDTPTVTVTAG
jgi:hypothetical protein